MKRKTYEIPIDLAKMFRICNNETSMPPKIAVQPSFPFRLLLLFPVLLFVAGRVSAQESDDGIPKSGPLGLLDLTRMALRNSVDLEEARGNFRIAEAEYRAVRDRENPTLRIGYDWDDVFEDAAGEVDRNEGGAARIRFYPKSPFVLRRQLQTAAAAIQLADFLYAAKEREVVLKVRELYAKTQFAERTLRERKGIQKILEDELTRLNVVINQGKATRDVRTPLQKAMYREMAPQATDRSRLIKAKSELAAYVGLVDAGRIAVSRKFEIPQITEWTPKFEDMLIRTALTMRPEVGERVRRQAISLGRLREIEARKIPWFSFIEGGVAYDRRESRKTEINFGIRVGIELPLFNWFNKEDKIHKAALDSYARQIDLAQRRIISQVRAAINAVRVSKGHLRTLDTAASEQLNDYRSDIPDDKVIDSAYELRVLQQEMVVDRLRGEELYYEAILALERQIGVDLWTVFEARRVK